MPDERDDRQMSEVSVDSATKHPQKARSQGGAETSCFVPLEFRGGCHIAMDPRTLVTQW